MRGGHHAATEGLWIEELRAAGRRRDCGGRGRLVGAVIGDTERITGLWTVAEIFGWGYQGSAVRMSMLMVAC